MRCNKEKHEEEIYPTMILVNPNKKLVWLSKFTENRKGKKNQPEMLKGIFDKALSELIPRMTAGAHIKSAFLFPSMIVRLRL